MQQQIDFCSQPQNSESNQAILEAVKPRLNKQCRILLHYLQSGERLTVSDGIKGLWDYEDQKIIYIGDVRARVRDIKEKGYDIKHETMPGGYRKYYL